MIIYKKNIHKIIPTKNYIYRNFFKNIITNKSILEKIK